MVGLRMIQISGMGEQRFKSGKKCRFSPFLASVARTHSLAQQTSSLQGLGHFGQYLGSPQGLKSLRTGFRARSQEWKNIRGHSPLIFPHKWPQATCLLVYLFQVNCSSYFVLARVAGYAGACPPAHLTSL